MHPHAIFRKLLSGCALPSSQSLFAHAHFVAVATLLLSLAMSQTLSAQQSAREAGDHSFESYREQIKSFCLDCHSTAASEGELDLEHYQSLADFRKGLDKWNHVVEQLQSREMPPADSPQPSEELRQQLIVGLKELIDAEIISRAGDPGDVVLRRLNNAEYTYTIQDLTLVALNPGKEFPVDSAAGEGFVNSGEALAMSPALLQKYLDAGRDIASHAVLLPDGFRFSSSNTRRDWADEIVARIRGLYFKHTTGISDTHVLDQWADDPTKSTANDGRIDLRRYIASLIRHRDEFSGNPAPSRIAEIAKLEELSPVYLTHLVQRLLGPESQTPLLAEISRAVLEADAQTTETAAQTIADDIRRWQDVLWKFNTVGQMGLIRPWQSPASNNSAEQILRTVLDEDQAGHVAVELNVHGIESPNDPRNNAQIALIFEDPRIEFPGRPPLLLKDIRGLQSEVASLQAEATENVAEYLSALNRFVVGPTHEEHTLPTLATEAGLNVDLLQAWAEFVGFSFSPADLLRDHLHAPMQNVAGFEALTGWGSNGLPELLANRSDESIRFSTLSVPAHGITVHPTPTQEVLVAWQSPIASRVAVSGKIADMDGNCGNGVTWRVERVHQRGTIPLLSGAIENGHNLDFVVDAEVNVAHGDVLWLAISPRDSDHSCDTTHIDFSISQGDTPSRVWNLSSDISSNLLDGNPHTDAQGTPGVWHFLRRDVSGSLWQLPTESSLAQWRNGILANASEEELAKTAQRVAATLHGPAEQLSAPEQQLRQMVMDANGPFHWLELGIRAEEVWIDDGFGLPATAFGGSSAGVVADDKSILVTEPTSLRIELPKALVQGGTFVTNARLVSTADRASAVQVELRTAPAVAAESKVGKRLVAGAPILSVDQSRGRVLVEQAYDDFRWLFPAAMCHARIIPVDEVVTLVLYHREDEALMRLMMTAEERKELDKLWQELRFVSQDPLRMEVALEQILEFATQDADPRVFDPLLDIIAENAKVYRQDSVDAEGPQVEKLIEFAERAYRRPLASEELQRLRSVYQELRDEQLPHEEAWRWTLARILASPAFLYRLEAAPESSEPGYITQHELANRLSYFLWSSLPDDQLASLATKEQLAAPEQLLSEARRMMSDPKSRRMAVEFGLQWMGLRDFTQLDEKSESKFPEFLELREDMAEETTQFFQFMIQENRSILELIDSDYTFLNAKLAEHYGIPGIEGNQWRQVNGVQEAGRGGILMHASVLARQSGASRTSPILRGNWLSESILGERLPRPPKDVPVLPDGDDLPAELSVRELVERHASDPACAKCHAKIDPYGFALENYDAIGRYRAVDELGREFETKAVLPDGYQLEGSAGLRSYLLTERRQEFVRHFCRKLLGFALGRSVVLSDQPLLDEMVKNLEANEFRFMNAIEPVILSPQFRMIRGRLSEF